MNTTGCKQHIPKYANSEYDSVFSAAIKATPHKAHLTALCGVALNLFSDIAKQKYFSIT